MDQAEAERLRRKKWHQDQIKEIEEEKPSPPPKRTSFRAKVRDDEDVPVNHHGQPSSQYDPYEDFPQ